MRERPIRDRWLMKIASVVAERSTCARLQVGVVVARDGRILVTGYNGSPSGMDHCDHECDCGFPGHGGMIFEGRHLSTCATVEPCTISVHAEANAIAYAARHGISIEGAELHSTDSPCLPCAQLIINAGIVKVHYGREYRRTEGLDLVQQAGLKVMPGIGWA